MEIKAFGTTYYFNDTPTIGLLVDEIFNDSYKIFAMNLEFRPGDIVLDIGANEGVFSIMLAKLYPYIKVVAVEPVQRTFFQLMRNIGLNGITNIEPLCVGVGAAPGQIDMIVSNEMSGGSSGAQKELNLASEHVEKVEIVTLDSLLARHERVRLLKMDIEGMEYEALYPSQELSRVDNFVGEFHMNKSLHDQGRDMEQLAAFLGARTYLLYFTRCQMAE
jgi:FkbM family methyltransferase